MPIITNFPSGFDALQSVQLEHRLGRSLNDFFIAVDSTGQKANLDDYWDVTTAKIKIGTGGIHRFYSRKAFNYAWYLMNAQCATRVGRDQLFGLEPGAGSMGLGTWFRIHAGFFRTYTKHSGGHSDNHPSIEVYLPADYDSAMHRYGIKVNKHQVWYFIDETLVSVCLLGLTEAIPTWDNAEPYSIGSIEGLYCAATILGAEGTGDLFEFGPMYGNSPLAMDGDPCPPIQLSLYTENTATKWKALATAGNLQTSHPVPIWGYQNKTLYFMADAAGTLTIQVYVSGDWRDYDTPVVAANTLVTFSFPAEMQAPIMRCTYEPTNNDTITLAELHEA